MRTFSLLFALAGAVGAGAVGCGERVVERTIYVDRYPDGGAQGPCPRDPGAAPEHGFGEGEGEGGDGLSDSFDAGSGQDPRGASDAGSGSFDGAQNGVTDREPPRVEYEAVEQFFGAPRMAAATISDDSRVDAEFILTDGSGLENRVTIQYGMVDRRGVPEGATHGVYRAQFNGEWDRPGNYFVRIEATDSSGNKTVSDNDLFVLDAYVVRRDPPNGLIAHLLSYDDWKRYIVDGDLFEAMFNRRDGEGGAGETHAERVRAYEALLGQRVAGGREYQKMPSTVLLIQSGDAGGTLTPVYGFSEEESNWHLNLDRVQEYIGVRATEALVEQALRSD